MFSKRVRVLRVFVFLRVSGPQPLVSAGDDSHQFALLACNTQKMVSYQRWQSGSRCDPVRSRILSCLCSTAPLIESRHPKICAEHLTVKTQTAQCSLVDKLKEIQHTVRNTCNISLFMTFSWCSAKYRTQRSSPSCFREVF